MTSHRRKVWTPNQIQTFPKSVQHDRFAALFLPELTTGIHRGQLCGLKWSDVDLDKCEITAHDNRVVVAGHARDKAGGKTENADQTISIDRATASALRRWRGVQDREREFLGTDYHPRGCVFTFEDGRGRGALADHLPDLRHSYATGALKGEISAKAIRVRIGHANVGVFPADLRARSR
jgi:integrase